MDGPPGVACMDTRHPRRLLAPEQVLMRFSIIYDRPSASRRFECARRLSILLRFAGKTQGMESGLGQATEVRTATRYCNASSKAQIMPFCRGAGHGSKLCPSKQRLDRSTMVLIQPCFPGPLLLASGPILQQVLDVVQRSAAWSEPTPRTSSGQQVRDSRS